MDSDAFIIRFYIILILILFLSVPLAIAANEVQGIDGIFQYAENLFKNQQYTAAETEYLQLLSIDSAYANADAARYRLGWCAYYVNKYELAVMQFSTLIESYPKSSWFKPALQSRQFIYEISDFVPTVDSDPAIIPFNLARKYQIEKNDTDAIGFYERVIQNYPKSIYTVYAAYYIAQIHTENYEKLLGSFLEKKKECLQVAGEKVAPQLHAQRFAEAALQEELMEQQLQQTVLAYSRVTEHFPASFQRQLAHRNLAELYLQTGDFEKAKQEYRAIINLTRDYPNSLLGYQAQEKLKQLK